MLLNRKHPKQCGLCAWADNTAAGHMLCYHKGPVPSESKCRRFRYDPFKRNPPKPPVLKPAALASLETPNGE